MTADPRHERPAQIAVGLLKPCILAHLLGTSSAYGYELHHRLLAIGLECDLGTVYRALNTMEDEGLLRSTWERSQGGRSRRCYELNQSGADTVDAYVPAVDQLLRTAQAFLDMRRQAGGAEHGSAGAGAESEPPFPEDIDAEIGGAAQPSNAPEHVAELALPARDSAGT